MPTTSSLGRAETSSQEVHSCEWQEPQLLGYSVLHSKPIIRKLDWSVQLPGLEPRAFDERYRCLKWYLNHHAIVPASNSFSSL